MATFDPPSSLCPFPVKNNSGVTPAGQCGTWVKEPDGGYFTSPNYPEKYPPERECVYIIEGDLLLLSFSTPLSIFSFTCLCLQPLLGSASTCSLMTSIPSSLPGNASLITSRSETGPSASPHSSAATAARKAQRTCAPAAATSTSSLWRTVNWRPSDFLRGTTSRRVGVVQSPVHSMDFCP